MEMGVLEVARVFEAIAEEAVEAMWLNQMREMADAVGLGRVQPIAKSAMGRKRKWPKL